MYHYTPIEQVPGIIRHGGIHPRSVLRERGIRFNDDYGRWSNRREKAEALVDYVAVGVLRPWGMMREPDCVVFSIDSEVLLRARVAFMGGWSSRDEIGNIADVRAREGIASFDAMFDNPTTSWPSPVPGEVLVWGSIQEKDITCLYVRNEQHLEEVRQVLRRNNVQRRPPYGPRIAPPGFFPPTPGGDSE